jgi:hypothetical protein
MKQSIPFLFFLLLGIILIFAGCIQQDLPGRSLTRTPGTAVPATCPDCSTLPVPANTLPDAGNGSPGLHTSTVTGSNVQPATKTIPDLAVNYTDIGFIGKQDPSDPVDEYRKNTIVQAALSDDRVRVLLIDGGRIEGVLFQCHPTPKDRGGSACAMALRVLHNGSNWDFLVDETSRDVIFVQQEIPPGRI